MQVDHFWQHWQVTENPFRAEEARNDPVYQRLLRSASAHPEFEKIFGRPDDPTSAVVFGEKGSGKTAIRLLMEKLTDEHNDEYADRMAWLAVYHDLNPYLDQLKHTLGARDNRKLIAKIRVQDHMDAILSLVTTRLVDAVDGKVKLPHNEAAADIVKKMSRQERLDLATLAVLYDNPRSGNLVGRWASLRKLLRFGRVPWLRLIKWSGVAVLIGAVALAITEYFRATGSASIMFVTGILFAAAAVLLGVWAWRHIGLFIKSRDVLREVRVIPRNRADVHSVLAELPHRDTASQPIPGPGDEDSRYQLIARLMDLLRPFGYMSLLVFVDRVDEPAMINGDAEKMRDLVWPMLNNKFLQQDRVGVKMLLPVELRHLLKREDASFFQQARLDKQHMVDRLQWSGPMLYDLANSRLNICRTTAEDAISIIDLFDDEVDSKDLIDALDQMHQPRDAFKFLYQVILEHCSNVPQDRPIYKIPRLTLEAVRKQQSQRVQELYRGLTPA